MSTLGIIVNAAVAKEVVFKKSLLEELLPTEPFLLKSSLSIFKI